MPAPGVDVAAYYNGGRSWAEYLNLATKNVGRMKAFYEAFDFDEEVLTFYNGRTPLQVLAIVEDWCPDVAQNLAVMARICDEVPGMELSIVGRDENKELMDEYESGGRRRVPTFALFDLTFRELARWSGRCATADKWIADEVLKGRQWSEMGADELKKFNDEYDRRYSETYVWDTISEWQHLMEDEDF